MSIQSILDKILATANNEASLIRNRAEQDAVLNYDRVVKKSEEKIVDLNKEVDTKIVKAVLKSKYLAEVSGKDQVLKRKNVIIEDILTTVLHELSAIPAKEYEQFLSKLMAQVYVKDGVVYPAVWKENSTKGAVKISGKNFKISDSQDIIGGFIVKSDIADFDFSFETIVNKTFRKDIEEMIVSEIF